MYYNTPLNVFLHVYSEKPCATSMMKGLQRGDPEVPLMMQSIREDSLHLFLATGNMQRNMNATVMALDGHH